MPLRNYTSQKEMIKNCPKGHGPYGLGLRRCPVCTRELWAGVMVILIVVGGALAAAVVAWFG